MRTIRRKTIGKTRRIFGVVLLALGAVGVLENGGRAQTLFPEPILRVGERSQYFVTGDVNGDGRPDIVVLNNDTGTVSVLLGKGDGTFLPGVDYMLTSSGSSSTLLFADVNGDGKPDLIVPVSSGQEVVLFNNGDGTFGAPQGYNTGTTNSVAVGDVNGDGKPDLVVTSKIASIVSVLLNNGDGTFAAKTDYVTGSTPTHVAIGDVNGDGRPDLVVSCTGTGSVNVFLNTGNGTFGAKSDFIGADQVVLADLDGDGRLDILTIGTSLNVLYNQGNFSSLSGVVAFQGIDMTSAAQDVTFELRPSGGGASFTQTIPVTPFGFFTLAPVPADNYTLHVKSYKYLALNVPVDATGGNVSNLFIPLSAGDTNNDNVIDIADFAAIVAAYSSTASDPTSGYDLYADLNDDGLVDIADFGLFISNMNESGDL